MAVNGKHSVVVSRKVGDSFEPLRSCCADWWVPNGAALTTGVKTYAYAAEQGVVYREEVYPDGTHYNVRTIAVDVAPWSGVMAANVRLLSENGGSSVEKAVELGVALYIAKPATKRAKRTAKVWVERQKPISVPGAPEGATSAAILELGARRFLILTLDGRPEASQIYGIPMEIDDTGRAALGEDRVVFSAGRSEKRSRIRAVLVGENPFVLLPIWRTSQDFGLLAYRVGSEAENATWVDYPSRIDPAPVDASTLCGLPVVAFVRPETGEAKANHVLEMGWLNESGELQNRQVVATERKIEHVALSDEGSGRWLVYTTPDGLRGRKITCE